MKIKLVLGLAASILAVGLVWQIRAVHQLQEDNAGLQQQLAELKAAPASPSPDTVAPDELKRLRDEHIELMRLRGEYAQWQKKSATSSTEVGKLQNEVAAARRDADLKTEALAQETLRRNTEAANSLAKMQANICINNLMKINGAKEQWALENKRVTGAFPQDVELFGPTRYIAAKPVCPAGGGYTLNAIGTAPTCSVAGHTVP